MGFFSGKNLQGTRDDSRLLSSCGKCGLYKKCISPKMRVVGKGKRKILFVAQAPGKSEDAQGKQLIGEAGTLLKNYLQDLEVNLKDCWKTNAVICRPPKNKLEARHIESCRPNLLRTIKQLKPNVIVLLGMPAIQSLISTEFKDDLGALQRWVGWQIPSAKYNAWICPTYHPSFLIHKKEDPALSLLFEKHLQKAIDLEDVSPNPLDFKTLEKKIEIIKSPRLALARLRDLNKKEGSLAFDYETTGLKPEEPGHEIVTCSFCWKGKNTFAFPVTGIHMKAMSSIFRNPSLRKVAANLKFEERWTKHFFKHGIRNWHWDTMLSAHILDNRKGVTGLKFQSYVHFGIGDYDSHIKPYLVAKHNKKNRIHELDMGELLLYNGLDSLLEYKLMVLQKKLMKGMFYG